jgi:hypothetical protein
VSRDKIDTTATVELRAAAFAEAGTRLPDLADLAGRDYQELWFALARRPWRSAVLVPAEASLRTDELAAALASIGRRLGFTQVSALVAEQIDFASVGQLTSRLAAPAQSANPVVSASTAQLIVSIPPVVVQPLGVAVARAADTVVLCLAMGRTGLRDAERTIELVGRERICGAVVLPAWKR